MAEPRQQQPSIGRIVIYHSRSGVDMPAIITALGEPDWEPDPDNEGGQRQVWRYVHLHLFPPPGEGPDPMSHEHGVRQQGAYEYSETWRWPERV